MNLSLEETMHNRTNDGQTTSSFFTQYLLGDSYKNILLRLAIILCAILTIWSGLMVTLVFYIRCQRRKHLQSLLESHFHLYGSKQNLTRNQYKELKRRSQYHSSKKLHSTMKALPSSNYSVSIRRAPTLIEKSKLPVNINHTHAIIKAMTKPPLIFNDKVNTTTTTKADGSCPKTNHLHNNGSKKRSTPGIAATKPPLSNVLGNAFSVTSHSIVHEHNNFSIFQKETNIDLRSNLSRDDRLLPRKPLRQVTIEIGRFDNIRLDPSSLTERASHHRPFHISSFLHNLTSHKRRYALSNDHITNTDRHSQYLPLVMITDTNASYTNIVELETFEDKQRTRTETERRLIYHLRASRRSRHST